jgi:heme exporter protein D
MTTQELDANTAKGNILPNSVRRFEVKWGSATPLPTTASFFDNVKYQYENFALGMYTADLSLQFGSSGQANNSFTFYVFPWQLVSVVLLGLILLWVIAHLVIKHHDKMIIQQLRKMQRREK